MNNQGGLTRRKNVQNAAAVSSSSAEASSRHSEERDLEEQREIDHDSKVSSSLDRF